MPLSVIGRKAGWNLYTNHGAHDHKDRNHNRVPKTDGQDENRKHQPDEAIRHSKRVALSVSPGGGAEAFGKSDSVLEVVGVHRVVNRVPGSLPCRGTLGGGVLIVLKGFGLDGKPRYPRLARVVSIAHEKPPWSQPWS